MTRSPPSLTVRRHTNKIKQKKKIILVKRNSWTVENVFKQQKFWITKIIAYILKINIKNKLRFWSFLTINDE